VPRSAARSVSCSVNQSVKQSFGEASSCILFVQRRTMSPTGRAQVSPSFRHSSRSSGLLVRQREAVGGADSLRTVMSVSKEEYQKRRFQACLNALPRSLNTNINPGFMLPRRGFAPAIWTGGDAPVAGPVTSEYLSRYQFRVTPINKDMHLKKDEIKLVRIGSPSLRPMTLSTTENAVDSCRDSMLKGRCNSAMSARACLWYPPRSGHRQNSTISQHTGTFSACFLR